MIGHYLTNFVVATAGMVGLLYVVYFCIRHGSQFGPLRTSGHTGRHTGLKVESVLNLEPRKRLYVISHGQQQFLMAATMDKIELLTTLEACPPVADEGAEQMLASIAACSTVGPPPITGFMDRLKYSFKLVLADRFTSSSTGGR